MARWGVLCLGRGVLCFKGGVSYVLVAGWGVLCLGVGCLMC